MGICLQNVSYSYSNTKKNKIYAIKDINIEINKNDEFISLIGETGSGKSTLSSIMNALRVPTEGDAYIFGIKLRERRKRGENYNKLRKNVGLVFQFPEYQLFEETVLRDVMFAPKNYGKTKEEAEEVSRKVLNQVGLSESLFEKTPFTLSGGEKKLVSIAGILSMEPDIIILDEPTAGLDPETRNKVLSLLKWLGEVEHKSIIIITHDMNIVMQHTKRAVVMSKGLIVFDGSPSELFKKDEKTMSNLNLDYPDSISLARYLNNKCNLNLSLDHIDLKSLIGELNKWRTSY